MNLHPIISGECKYIIISDVHGHFHTMMDLIGKYPDRKVILAGDFIDGKHAKSIIDWIFENKNKCFAIRGRREDSCLSHRYHQKVGFRALSHDVVNGNWWLQKDGWQTLASYSVISRLPINVLHFLDKLPLSITIQRESNKKDILVSNNGCAYPGNYNYIIALHNSLSPNYEEILIQKNFYNVFGSQRRAEVFTSKKHQFTMINTLVPRYIKSKMSCFLYPEMTTDSTKVSEKDL